MPKIVVDRKGRVASLLNVQYFKFYIGFSLVFVVLSFVLPLWRLFPDLYGKEIIPLHYNIHFGVDWTGAWWRIFVYPVSGVILSAFNTLLALFLVKREPMLARVVLISTMILTAFLLCSTVFVVLMNVVYG